MPWFEKPRLQVSGSLVVGCCGNRQQLWELMGQLLSGPFRRPRAVVGGFSIIEVPTREEALDWAARIAKGCRCAQEVREIMFDPES